MFTAIIVFCDDDDDDCHSSGTNNNFVLHLLEFLRPIAAELTRTVKFVRHFLPFSFALIVNFLESSRTSFNHNTLRLYLYVECILDFEYVCMFYSTFCQFQIDSGSVWSDNSS